MPISSPPLTYTLDPVGTSGIAVGPQIIIVDDDLNVLPSNMDGNILVRGPPCFHGYEGDDASNDASFCTVNGLSHWFRTGDCGRLDAQGYLFITGRSKEIINRGGETISPFEIEEAVMQCEGVQAALAFSVPHDILQETVGVVIVMKPSSNVNTSAEKVSRIDLITIHNHLQDRLVQSKWPQIVVFMNSLPKNNTGKLLRIKLADRFGLESVHDHIPMHQRLFIADCPPIGTPLHEPIPCHPMDRDEEIAKSWLRSQLNVEQVAIVCVDSALYRDVFVALVSPATLNTVELHSNLIRNSGIDYINMPYKIFAIDNFDGIAAKYAAYSPTSSSYPPAVSFSPTSTTMSALSSIATMLLQSSEIVMPRNDIEAQLVEIYKSVLELSSVSVMSSFVLIGGDSLKAGKLISMLRSTWKVKLYVSDLYELQTIEKLGEKIQQLSRAAEQQIETASNNSTLLSSKSLPSLKHVPQGDSIKLASSSNDASDMKLNNPLKKKYVFDIESFSVRSKLSKGHSSLFPAADTPLRRASSGSSNSTNSTSSLTVPTYGSVSTYISIPLEEGDESAGDDEEGEVKETTATNSKEMESMKGIPKPATGKNKSKNRSKSSPSSTSVIALTIQALPLVLLFPLRRLISLFLVAYFWTLFMANGLEHHRLMSLLLALGTAKLVLDVCGPILAIVLKWLIIGKFKVGKYRLFGAMYLRWWLLEQILKICGRGVFDYPLKLFGSSLLVWYYRLLGCDIGKGVIINNEAQLGGYDLLIIGNNVVIDKAIIRATALEPGYLIFLPIYLGDKSSVGLKSIVAPGAVVDDDMNIGPQSSSHELQDCRLANRKYNRQLIPSPPAWVLYIFGYPLVALVTAISWLPWLFVVMSICEASVVGHWWSGPLRNVEDVIDWWTKPQRILFFFGSCVARQCGAPPIHLLLTILIKRYAIGKFTPATGEEFLSVKYRFRYWIMKELLPGAMRITKLVGSHYEIVSIIYRLLGATVGERVYWPGSGLDVVEFDLLHIGDDVVFGSRSVVMTSSTERSAPVRIESGCMVADRCVLLPGSVLKKGAVLGSGGLCKENGVLQTGSVWVGSTKGHAVCFTKEDKNIVNRSSKSPFGRAYYDRKANYYVYPQWLIAIYSSIWHSFCAVYNGTGVVASIFLLRRGVNFDERVLTSSVAVFFVCLLVCVVVMTQYSLGAMLIDILAKWCLIGKRKTGSYPWDTSSYCQRWQLHLTIQEIRRYGIHDANLLEFLQGSEYLVLYFRALGGKIGKNVCLYPHGGDPMMTEPDLVEIGDNVSVDDASLIAHYNTRGRFRFVSRNKFHDLN